MTLPENNITVSLGEISVSRDPGTILTCLGLGSCIGLCMHDPTSGVGGMAHIVLPFSNKEKGASTKYADIAIPFLLNEMAKNGASRGRLVAKLAGGSQMLKIGSDNIFKTGERNLEAVKEVLRAQSITIAAANVGGTKGRSFRLFVGTGRVLVRTIGEDDVEL